jgi:alpha-glucan,water dikinase
MPRRPLYLNEHPNPPKQTGIPPRLCALQALAVSDRLSRVLAAAGSATQAALQPTADALGAALGLNGPEAASVVEMFAEEEVRAGPAAALSNLLAALQPRLLAAAGATGWQIISRGAATAGAAAVGPLLQVESLSDAAAAIAAAAATAGAPGACPMLLVRRLQGNEDVPPDCCGVVVTGHCPDVLSHAAVRARAVGVPLVACLDSREAARVEGLAGRTVALSLRGEDVDLQETDASAAAPTPAAGAAAVACNDGAAPAAAKLDGPAPWGGQWLLPLTGFQPGSVGAKAANTRRLALDLPAWLQRPASVALPFGVLEEGVMGAPANAAVAAEVTRLSAQLEGASDAASRERLLSDVGSQVMRLQPPEALLSALSHALSDQLLPGALAAAAGREAAAARPAHLVLGADAAQRVWGAALAVWASQWGAGAEAALATAGLPRDHLRMGVLVQPVVPLRYAFVAHTCSPTTGSREEVYVEVVQGLGEALVSGDYPGRALGGCVARGALDAALDGGAADRSPLAALPPLDELRAAVRVASYPSKSHVLLPTAPGRGGGQGAEEEVVFMARSDSNAGELSPCSRDDVGPLVFPKTTIPTTPNNLRLITTNYHHPTKNRRGPPRLQRRRPLRVPPLGCPPARPGRLCGRPPGGGRGRRAGCAVVRRAGGRGGGARAGG